ncbi:fluoride efflux transporter CrcB [Bacillus sp. 31A1R]|uniref:Fluoride-specific ion channel FluC n=1 Tax=Robertmurraya mangrovi TaxID=3098077 RepID=A0ABU5J513_9BACI|nr:fluoride efflux transporter CrcB [Bacillus sp. 31A1R]MDZ5474498.1 fluoride efflux transporter CrcB [Bacillus sp. 31A1R]
MFIYLLVGLGGAIGSVLRYLLFLLTFHHAETSFPYGTLIANLVGAFFLGWFTKNFISTNKIKPEFASAIGTGLIGSFTTFSTLSNETIALFQNHHYISAFIYLFLSIFGGLFLAYIGLYQKGETEQVGENK